jgi:hypothetical protein
MLIFTSSGVFIYGMEFSGNLMALAGFNPAQQASPERYPGITTDDSMAI